MADLGRWRTSSFPHERDRCTLVCPKPRRLAIVNHFVTADAVRPLRHPSEHIDSKAGLELLDIFSTKGVPGSDYSACVSPPYFSGSPPCRAPNPLVHDTRFMEERNDISPVLIPAPSVFGQSPAPSPSPTSPSTNSVRKGCARATFGPNPAAVRIEGFDCLDRDRRGCSITAMA